VTPHLRVGEARRLAFIKYVFQIAAEHSARVEPNCAVSLLQLHDGAELLLQLAAEHVDVRVDRNTPFLGFWPLLGSALGRDVPHHGAMKRLNEARVGLKHHGHLPSRVDVRDLVEAARAFVRDLTPMVFGLSWEEVSRADYIHSERARGFVKEAEEALARRDFDACRISCRKAYETLDTEYSPFQTDDELLRAHSPYEILAAFGTKTESPLEWIMVELTRLRQAVGALAIGLDPRRVKHFLDTTPIVAHSANWKWHVVQVVTRPPATAAEAEFCLEFVLDAAMKIESQPNLESMRAV
jgi:hypothetical protein